MYDNTFAYSIYKINIGNKRAKSKRKDNASQAVGVVKACDSWLVRHSACVHVYVQMHIRMYA